MELAGAQEDYQKKVFMIDNQGKRKIVKPTSRETIWNQRQQDYQEDYGPGPGANTQEELEMEDAEDAIQELEQELDLDIEDMEGISGKE
jgi:hypothetical protein